VFLVIYLTGAALLGRDDERAEAADESVAALPQPPDEDAVPYPDLDEAEPDTADTAEPVSEQPDVKTDADEAEPAKAE